MKRAATIDMTEKLTLSSIMSKTSSDDKVHAALQSAIERGSGEKGLSLKRQDSMANHSASVRRVARTSLVANTIRRQTEVIEKDSKGHPKLLRARTMDMRVNALALDVDDPPTSPKSGRTSAASIRSGRTSAASIRSGRSSSSIVAAKSFSGIPRSETRLSLVSEHVPANPTNIPVEQLLHKIPMFQRCSYEFVETLVLHLKTRMLRQGQSVVEEGAEGPRSMFFVSLGDLEIASMGEATGSSLGVGEAFGEDMVLSVGSRWHCSLRASSHTQCMVCELSHDSFEETLSEFPEEQSFFSSIREQSVSLAEAHEKGEQWKVLRRCAILGRCSDELLQKIDHQFVRRLYFPGECLCSEGDLGGKMYVVEHGSVVVSVAGRAVHLEEIPNVQKKLVREAEPSTPKKKLAVWTECEDTRLAKSSPCSPTSGRPNEENNDMEAPRFSKDVPEAAVFGEEALLGISSQMTKSLVAKTVSIVRILHRSSFLKLLEQYPQDGEHLSAWLQRQRCNDEHKEDDFPAEILQEYLPFLNDECSTEFYDFISKHVEERLFRAGDIVALDNFHKHVHHVVPETNISLCKIRHGQIRMMEKSKRVVTEDADLDQLLSVFFKSSEQEPVDLEPGSIITGAQLWEGSCVFSATEVSLVCILHRGVLAAALEMYPLDSDIVIPALGLHTHIRVKQKGSAKVAKILRERSIFGKASQEFLDEVIQCGITRVFMPGDHIIEQDTDGTSMFILKLGSCSVVTERSEEESDSRVRTFTHVGVLPHGSVFGELVMLGVHPKRTASIIASTLCCTWEIAHKNCLGILERHPMEKEHFLKLVETHLEKLAAPRMIHLALFSDFSQQFRTMLGVNCEKKMFFPGETIVHEGSPGDKLYIMNLGSASLCILHQHVMHVTGGSHFGFGAMSGTQDKYPATVVAETICQVLIVTSAMYRNALRQYPDMVEVAKTVEANEKMLQSKQKESFMQTVRRRRGLRCIVEALRSNIMGQSEDDEREEQRQLLEITFESWHGVWIRRMETQEKEEEIHAGNMRRINEWLQKRQQQMAIVRPRADMKRLIYKNIVRRGPLKLPEKSTLSQSPRRPISETWNAIQAPYLSPSPVWNVHAISKKSPRRLAPLGSAISSPANTIRRIQQRTQPYSLEEVGDPSTVPLPSGSLQEEFRRGDQNAKRQDSETESNSDVDVDVDVDEDRLSPKSFLLAAGDPFESLLEFYSC